MKSDLPWGVASGCPIEDADVIILGIPFDGAVSFKKGAAAAPDRLRELSRILPLMTEEGVSFNGLKIRDEGDMPPHLDWEKYYGQVKQRVNELLTQNKFYLFLGGDHSVAIPLLSAFSQAHSGEDVGIIHFDSHCDIADEFDGHRWSHACPQRRALELPNVKPENLTLVGIRSFMEDELEFLRKHPQIRVITARDIYKQSLDHIIQVITERYQHCHNIYLTIDIDVLDPAFAPGTGTPESGGLSTRELMELVKEIMARLPVTAVDCVEIAPPLDSADITSWAALKIIYEIFGEVYKRKTKTHD
jgi:agmatinase